MAELIEIVPSVGSLSLTDFFWALAILYGAYWATVMLYNIKFHPLAGFPGPLARAGVHFVGQYSEFTGNEVRDLKALHDKYGDVVRISPDSLSFNTAQAAKDIYGLRHDKQQMPKDQNFYGKGTDGVASLMISNDADHARIRSNLAHAFSSVALREQEPILVHYFDLLISRLKDRIRDEAHVTDIVRSYNFTTFDIIGDLCFGESFSALSTQEYHPWVNNIFKGVKFGKFLRVGRRYPLLGYILDIVLRLFPSVNKARNDHAQFTVQKTEKRLDTSIDRKDFMTYILRHQGEKGMTRAEITHTSSVLIIGGSETTATLLSGMTYYLLMNPSKHERVQDEVRRAFPQGTALTVSSTAQLKYLSAVIQETLRLYPPVPCLLPRRTNHGGTMISGTYVPGNITVGLHHLATYHSAKNFTDPDHFVPEHWLDNPPDRYKKDKKASLQPFLLGPRNCIGQNLAWVETHSIMARMLLNFNMELCEESRHWHNQKVFSLWDKPPLQIKLSPHKV